MNKRNYLPEFVRTYLRFVGMALVVFGLLRLLLFTLEYDRVGDASSALILESFVMGLRFDLVIACYLILLPFFLSTLHNLGLHFRFFRMATRFLLYGGMATAFVIATVDVPYFRQFFDRLSVSVFSWTDSAGFMFNMVVQEARYILFAIPMFLILFGFFRFARKRDAGLFQPMLGPVWVSVPIVVLCFGLIVLGIRGRIEKKSPIRIGTAYFSNNAFLNKLGLNANFTLIRTYLDELEADERTEIYPAQQAWDEVSNELGIEGDRLERRVEAADAQDYNVVLVLMESMSTYKMHRHGNEKDLTPFLDSLTTEGLYYPWAFSTGIHTFNGVYSTLFGMPSYYRRHPMKGVPKSYPSSLFRSLGQQGYSTAYFTTHDGQFDNIEGFLKANDCQTVVSSKDYPSEAIESALGVTDDYMFQFALPYLDRMAQKGAPFVATFMTASDHGPYVIPEDFECRNPDVMDCIVEFADHSIRRFIQAAQQRPWYDNTLFVFIGDHGASISSTYDVPLAYTHVPLLFYGAGVDSAQVDMRMASQVDVFPTIMGLLGHAYINTSLGVDLRRSARDYSVFCYDDKLGVIDRDWFYCQYPDGRDALYHHPSRSTVNQRDSMPEKRSGMEAYGKMLLQVYMDKGAEW